MRHRLETVLLLTLLLAAPAAASTARLIGPDGRCVGLAGEAVEGTAVRLESCDGSEDQLWTLLPRGSTGQIRQSLFCFDGSAMRLADCRTGSTFDYWRHDTDGRLSTGVSGLTCLAATDQLALAPCGEAENQRFFAEGHDAWTPRLAGGPLRFLPIQTGDPQVWYGRSGNSLVRSDSGGRSFVHLRKDDASSAFMVSPRFDSHTVYSMDSAGVVSRSQDDGRSWTPVLDMPQQEAGAQRQIVPSQIDPQRIYAFGALALWSSNDRGLTFTKRGALPEGRTGDRRLLDLGGGHLLYLYLDLCLNACPPENLSLWRSSDEGASWLPVLRTEAVYPSVALLGDPRLPDTYYLTMRPAAEESDQVFRSVDGGRTFAFMTVLPGRDGQLFADPGLPSTFYYLTPESLYRNENVGFSPPWFFQWSPLQGERVHASRLSLFGGGRLRLSALLEDESGGLAGVAYFDSEDGGASFSRSDAKGPDLTSDPLPALVTSRQGRVYFRSGAFLERSDDGGRTWQKLAEIREAVELAADPHDSATIIARSASGELHRSADAGATFSLVSAPGPASAFAVFVHEDRTVVLAASQPSFYRSLDRGATWTTLPSPRTEQIFAKLVADGSKVYGVTETGELYASSDGGETFARRGIAGQRLAAGAGLLAYPVQEQDRDPRVRVSNDGGETFVDRYPPEERGTIAAVEIDAGGNLYVAGVTTVLRSRDLGRTWQSLNRDLVTAGSALVTADPFDGAKLYHSSALGLQLGRWDEAIPLDLGPRFGASLKWASPLGFTGGAGVPVALTRDSGMFWLFTPERAEVAVKVLDGRSINGRWWVFLASMTDVQLFLQIEDRVTGQVWRYNYPAGRLLSFGDTAAFPSGNPDQAIPAPPPPGGQLLGTATKVPIDDRFEVSVEWSTQGAAGSGQGRQLNHDSAAFYFFDPANVELVVNLIDGRPVNGKYWVYFGSMSDVEFTVTVKDRSNGAVKTYFNPAGSFASVGDTQAFE